MLGAMLSWHSLGESSRPVARDWLTAGEAERAATMRFTKRRDEWLLARWTAKQALARQLDLPHDPSSLVRIEIRTIIGGPAQGAPEVFVDGERYEIGVSLTDRPGAWCAPSARSRSSAATSNSSNRGPITSSATS